jgi:hypothetical protein
MQGKSLLIRGCRESTGVAQITCKYTRNLNNSRHFEPPSYQEGFIFFTQQKNCLMAKLLVGEEGIEPPTFSV